MNEETSTKIKSQLESLECHLGQMEEVAFDQRSMFAMEEECRACIGMIRDRLAMVNRLLKSTEESEL
tara:strand:+ start:251 stop:451 length:201 start_codon:yes stop_codon:yes gene_type:complete